MKKIFLFLATVVLSIFTNAQKKEDSSVKSEEKLLKNIIEFTTLDKKFVTYTFQYTAPTTIFQARINADGKGITSVDYGVPVFGRRDHQWRVGPIAGMAYFKQKVFYSLGWFFRVEIPRGREVFMCLKQMKSGQNQLFSFEGDLMLVLVGNTFKFGPAFTIEGENTEEEIISSSIGKLEKEKLVYSAGLKLMYSPLGSSRLMISGSSFWNQINKSESPSFNPYLRKTSVGFSLGVVYSH